MAGKKITCTTLGPGLIVVQACFTNSTEVLFGALTLYHMRVIERLWGSRKFAVSRPILDAMLGN